MGYHIICFHTIYFVKTYNSGYPNIYCYYANSLPSFLGFWPAWTTAKFFSEQYVGMTNRNSTHGKNIAHGSVQFVFRTYIYQFNSRLTSYILGGFSPPRIPNSLPRKSPKTHKNTKMHQIDPPPQIGGPPQNTESRIYTAYLYTPRLVLVLLLSLVVDQVCTWVAKSTNNGNGKADEIISEIWFHLAMWKFSENSVRIPRTRFQKAAHVVLIWKP